MRPCKPWRRTAPRRAHAAQRGYVLLGTLVLLALLALVAERLAARIDQLRTQSTGIDAYAQGLVAAHSARAQLLFRIATSYSSPGGFTEADGNLLPADGRPIPMGDEVTATLHDERGLASLNVPDPQLLTRLLKEAGLPEGQAMHLLETLADYADTDSLSRLNGAEATVYADKGLIAPRNDWLQSPQELRQILGWVSHPEVVERLLPWVSSRRDNLFNPNTAPREVLQAKLPGLTPAQIDALLLRREIRPWAGSAEIRDLVGNALDGEDTLFFVGDTVKVTVKAKALPLAYTYNLVLTPGSATRPWVILDSRTAAPAPARERTERLP